MGDIGEGNRHRSADGACFFEYMARRTSGGVYAPGLRLEHILEPLGCMCHVAGGHGRLEGGKRGGGERTMGGKRKKVV